LEIGSDGTSRFDLKYWDPALTGRLQALQTVCTKTIKDINLVKTRRGKSPAAALYVDEADGYALVVKAGSNITKLGTIAFEGDYVEKNVFDEMQSVHIENGDILLSSTGDGTLGKCAVYRGEAPAIFDGHVTLIRVDQNEIYPEYLCDYLRAGFGAEQISRLYTGSTGLIELPPEQVDSILVPLPDFSVQKELSGKLRDAESSFSLSVGDANLALSEAQLKFRDS
jgi:type I restriction enzyme M protein